MQNREFRAFLDLMMCSDPWPESVDRAPLLALAEDESRKRGFAGWIEAYHKFHLAPEMPSTWKAWLKRWFWNNLVAEDQRWNALTGGDPDETISSRVAKRRANCLFCRWLCTALDRIDPGHCDKSLEPDEGDRAVF
jgi:hypothetical protein